jgi:hypothetical protein
VCFNNLRIQLESLSRIPLLSLILLGLAYILVGWQLSVNDIFGFVGTIAFTTAIFVALNSNPWLGGILGNLPQVLLFSASTSLLITFTLILPVILTVVIIPTLTTFLAWQELQFLKFSQTHTRKILLSMIGCGLVIGELIDLFVLPSIK